jgi:hypothetical protein
VCVCVCVCVVYWSWRFEVSTAAVLRLVSGCQKVEESPPLFLAPACARGMCVFAHTSTPRPLLDAACRPLVFITQERDIKRSGIGVFWRKDITQLMRILKSCLHLAAAACGADAGKGSMPDHFCAAGGEESGKECRRER